MSEEYGNDFVTLLDEEGNELEYEMIDAVEVDGNQYVALLPALVGEDEQSILDEDYQVVILKIENENGEDMLVSIDNEDEFNKVWAQFEERLSEDFDIIS